MPNYCPILTAAYIIKDGLIDREHCLEDRCEWWQENKYTEGKKGYCAVWG
jgi:hypothetical protein